MFTVLTQLIVVSYLFKITLWDGLQFLQKFSTNFSTIFMNKCKTLAQQSPAKFNLVY